MENLYKYIKESISIIEGGMSGHMSHIIDYTDLTLDNVKGIIYSLFNSRIDDVTEKLDGMNIQASMNMDGEVVFVRNKSDINNSNGGMTIDDMIEKWKGSLNVQQTFVQSGEIIERCFEKMGMKFFNPNKNTRIFVNCECMKEGITNVVPYKSSFVSFHDIWIYKKVDGEWVYDSTTKEGLDKLEKCLDENSKLTPKILLKTTFEGRVMMNNAFKTINSLFKEYSLKNKNTIEEYQKKRFEEYIRDHFNWILPKDYNIFFNRFIKGDKTINIREFKKMYPQHSDELSKMDKDKELKSYPNSELDKFMISLGNSVISQCEGFLNSGFESESIDILKDNINDTISYIKSNGDETTKTKLMVNLERLGNNTINATEGIVFRYKGRLMKLTGSFACVNQILGMKFEI